MNWNKININDESTFPPLGKKVMWKRFSEGHICKGYMVYAALHKTEFGYDADATLIDNEDYWFDIPDLII